MKTSAVSKTILWDLSLLLVAMIWGGGFVITKVCIEIMPPLFFLGFKFTIAGLLMCAIFWKNIRKAKLKDYLNGCIIGTFLALAFITQTIGLLYTTPAKSGFITGANVVMVPFIFWLVQRKSPGKKAYISALATFVGMGLLTMNESLSIGVGDLLTLACAVFFASHIVSVGYFANKTDALVVASIQVLFTGVACLLLSFPLEKIPDMTAFGLPVWLGLAYSTLLSTLAAFLIQNVAQKNTPSSHAAILLCLESVFSVIASAVFYHEVLSIKMIVGCTVIFVAILLNEVDFKAIIKKVPKEETL